MRLMNRIIENSEKRGGRYVTTVEKIMDIIEEHCEIVTQKQYDELYVAIESIILSDCGTCNDYNEDN